MDEGILFIRRNYLQLAHRLEDTSSRTGQEAWVTPKKKERAAVGTATRRGAYPRGRHFCLITPHPRLFALLGTESLGIQKGPLFIRWQEVRFRERDPRMAREVATRQGRRFREERL